MKRIGLLIIAIFITCASVLAQSNVNNGNVGTNVTGVGTGSGSGTGFSGINQSLTGGNVVNPLASAYGVKMDAQVCTSLSATLTITNASANVSCSTANFTTADLGKDIAVTINSCCLQNQSYLGTTAAIGKINAIVSSTTVTMSVTATGGAGSGQNGQIAWGHNDDAAWTLAEAAWDNVANRCGTLVVPSGYSMINPATAVHFNSPHPTCELNTGIESPLDYAPSMVGSGPGSSVFIIEPSGIWTNCVKGFGVSTNNGCYMATSQIVAQGFSFLGLGANVTAPGSATCVVNLGGGDQVTNVGFSGFGADTTNLVGVCAHSGVRFWGIACDGFGYQCMSFDDAQNSGAENVCYYCFIGDSGINLTVTGPIFKDYGGEYGPCRGTTTVTCNNIGATSNYLYGTSYFHSAGQTSANNTNQLYLSNTTYAFGIKFDNSGCNGGAGGSVCYAVEPQASSVTYLQGSYLAGSSSAETINNFYCSTTCKEYIDRSDTIVSPRFINHSTGTIIPAQTVAGSCTGTASSSLTIGLYGTGPQTTTTTTCTATPIGSGIVMDHAGTIAYLQVSYSAAGVAGDTVVVLDNNSALGTSITCAPTAGTSCSDMAHTDSFAAGDRISIEVNTGVAETLANVIANVGIF